jgi:hypothetical protein
MAKRKHKLSISGLWFFGKTRKEQQEYQKCTICGDIGIFSNDYMRTWYCSKHMDDKWKKQDDQALNQTNL